MKISLYIFSFLSFLLMMSCSSSNVPKQSAKTNFENTKWILFQMDGKEFSSENQTYIQFNSIDSKVNGSAACNNFFGTYKKNGSSLTFNPLASTKKACPEMEKETSFMNTLQNTAYFKIKGNVMTITDSNGKVILVFKTLQ